jgi:hypothetical protein
MLLNPFIYNKRNVIVFHIFNPAGIALTAFFISKRFVQLDEMVRDFSDTILILLSGLKKNKALQMQ